MKIVAAALMMAAVSMVASAQDLQVPLTPQQQAAKQAALAKAMNDANSSVTVDISVHAKNGTVAPEVKQDQISILVDKKPVTPSEFKTVKAGDEPQRVILYFDPLNLPGDDLKIVEGKVMQFLNRKDGKLPLPTAIQVAGPRQAQTSEFTTDAKTLADAFTKYTSKPAGGPGGGAPGGGEGGGGGGRGGRGGGGGSSQRALVTIQKLVQDSVVAKGRTAVLWMGQGWPLAFGPDQQLNDQQRLMLVRQAEMFTTALRRARVTIYMLDPIENDKFNPDTMSYQGFLKGPKTLSEGAPAFLGLQILAIHSGGWVQVSNDVSKAMDSIYAELGLYYRAAFTAEPTTKPDTLHTIDLKTPSKDIVARGADEYWVNPPMTGAPAK